MDDLNDWVSPPVDDWVTPQTATPAPNSVVADAIHAAARNIPSAYDLATGAMAPVNRLGETMAKGAAEGFGDQSLGLTPDQVQDFGRLGLPPELNRAALALVQTFALPIDAAVRLTQAAFTGGAAGLKQMGVPDDLIGMIEYELTKGEVAMRGSPRIGEGDAATLRAKQEEAAGAFSGAMAQAYNKPLALPAPGKTIETPGKTIHVEEEPVTAETSSEPPPVFSKEPPARRAAPPEAIDDWVVADEAPLQETQPSEMDEKINTPSQSTEIRQTPALSSEGIPPNNPNNPNNPSPTIPTKVIRRSPRKPPTFSTENSVLTNIIALGGVKTRDSAGNLTKEGQDFMASMKDVRRPGLVNNKTGLHPDVIRGRFREQGWFGPREDDGVDMQHLYDLVDKEVSEGRAYHPESQQGVEARGKQIVDENADALDDIKDRARKLGVTVHPSWEYPDIEAAVTEREAMMTPPEESTDWADERQAKIDADLDRVPFIEGTSANGKAEPGATKVSGLPGKAGEAETVRAQAGPLAIAEEEGRRTGTGTTSRAYGEVQGARPFQEEAGGDGGIGGDGKPLPQTIIPGAERSEAQAKQAVTTRATAEMKLRQQQSKLRKGNQESAGGMFDEGRNQTDLLAPANQQKPKAAPESKQAPLEPSGKKPASWVILDKAGNAAVETFSEEVAASAKHGAVPIGQYLTDYNRRVKEAGGVEPGTRAAPVDVTEPEHMEAVRDKVNTDPTEAQKEAGNYAKGHLTIHGMDITIENPKGSERSGVGKDGKKWSVKMPADYGYIKRTVGADGDHFDLSIGPNPKSTTAFVVDQVNAEDGKFDEHKGFVGFDSKKDALESYANGFSDGKGPDRMGAVTEMPVEEFKDYAQNGDTSKPLGQLPKERSGKEPYSFESFAQDEAKMRAGDMTAAEAMASFERVIASEAPLKAELATYPKERLAKMSPRNRNETKARIVDGLYSDFLNTFNATGSYSWSPFSGKGPTEGIRAAMTKQTDAHIKEAAEKRKARAAEMVKTYTNPETLTQFDDFVRVRGRDKLTSAQLAKYDELKAEAGRADQARETERKNVIKQVETPAEMSDIIETKHTQKGHDLFVVQLSDRVPKDVYTELAGAAKRLGGYYSSFRGKGAVPGFQFKTKEAAEKFRQVREGNVSKADMAAERAAEVKDNAVERLRDMAENLKEKADESLWRDRLANTARRANMAAGAEAQAAADKALSETMRNIADAIESGEAKNLGSVRTKIDIETLDGLLRTARYEAWKIANKADPSLSYEKMREQPMTREMVDKAEFPYPNAHVDTLKNLIEAVKERAGTKMAARRLQKTLDFAVREGDWRVRATNLGDMDDLFAVATAAKGTPRGYEADAVLESFKDYKRVVNMGLREPAALRAALREFLEYRGKAGRADPLKAAERALVGVKIEGYFPTPPEIASDLVERADIQPGMTVLEPSAGKGNIADAIRDAEPKANLSVIEPVSSLRNVLQMKGHNIVDSDFTGHEGQYDRIVMNPPFERGQDVEHVQRAYGMLKPDGRVVAIMSEHPFFANDSKSTQFRTWLESVGGESEKLPEGSFAKGERPTGVNMRVVTIDKSDVKHQIEKPEPPFYSALTRSIEQGKTAKAHGSQWAGIIKNAPGVKKEEVEWSGINEWLAEQKGLATKEQVADFLKANQVEVKDVEHGTPTPKDVEKKYDALLAENSRLAKAYEESGWDKSDHDANAARMERMNAIQEELKALEDAHASAPTKYAQYTLPGGENYRELLLTLPHKQTWLDGSPITAEDLATPHGRATAARVGSDADATFRSGHWDEPNILAHVRFDDRTGPNGEKILHVAEVQSDWHQKGRRGGYRQDIDKMLTPEERELRDLNAKTWSGRHEWTEEEGERALELQKRVGVSLQAKAVRAKGVVPDAPFKSTWHELAMKRMLRYAAENGYDRLSWDTGATAADRFDLSKRLQSITYQKRGDKFALWYVDRPDGRATKMGTYAADKLPDVVGKDVADKIVNGGGKKVGFYGEDAGTMELSGLDLKVGGEGMAGFYDKILPDFMNKYAKKWGAKVSTTGLTRGDRYEVRKGAPWAIYDRHTQTARPAADEAFARKQAAELNESFAATDSVHSLPITDAMRESVMGGQPLFNKPPKGWESAETSSDRMPMTVAEMKNAKYRQTPLGEMTDTEKAIADEVTATLERLTPSVKKLGVRALRAGDQRISGLASSARNLIVWSLEASDPVHTARHEAVHMLREMFTDEEWATLEKGAEDGGWIENHGIPSRYPKGSKTLHLEESIAEEFGDWRRKGRKGWPEAIHRLFNRIDLALRRIAAAVRRIFGKSATVEDIFTRMETGEVGKREGKASTRSVDDVKFETPGPKTPPRPKGVPVGSSYSASRKIWRDPTGKLYFDENGKPTSLEAKPDLKPIAGKGEEKVRGLSASIEADAIAEGMEAFGDLPHYNVLKNKDQIGKAIRLRDQNYARALNIALGKERAPEGVLPEAVLMAVRNKARKENDWETQRLLATNSHLSTEATTMGQRIQMLGVRDLADPVSAMQAIKTAREAMAKKRGIDAAKETEKMVAEARAEVKKTAKAGKRQTWEAFMAEITCKDS